MNGDVDEPAERDGGQDVDHTADQGMRSHPARSERRIDPGIKALFITGAMLVLVMCYVLPWIGPAQGWRIVVGEAGTVLDVGLLPRLFSLNSGIAGILLSAVALTTRRWALSWLASVACGIVSLEGVLAIWSRQTVPQAGPGPGLVIAVVCMFVIAFQWLSIAWSRE